MPNIIIKTDEQRSKENKILNDFGYNPEEADRSTREYAETAARKTTEAIKEMEASSNEYC